MAARTALFSLHAACFFGVALIRAEPAPGAAAPVKRPRPSRTDRYGDLPEGAVARLGTLRLRVLADRLRFSADGKTLLGVDHRFVRVWDAATGRLLATHRLVPPPQLIPGRFDRLLSADGRTLVHDDGASVGMWELPSGKRLDIKPPTGRKPLSCLAVSDDRLLLLFAEQVEHRHVDNGTGLVNYIERWNVLLWDARAGKPQLLVRDEKPLALSPNCKYLVSSSSGGLRVREAATGKLLWQKPQLRTSGLAFTPDSRHLIAAPAGDEHNWLAWCSATGQPPKRLRPPTVGSAWGFAVAPDGGSVIIPLRQKVVLWDLRLGRQRHAWPTPNWARGVLFAPDGRSVVTSDTILRRWDVATGKLLYEDVSALGHTAPVRRLFFTPDGKRLVSIGEDDTLRIWDVARARQIHPAQRGTTGVTAWAMLPDGSSMAGVDERLNLRWWPLADGRPRPGRVIEELAHRGGRLQAVDARISPDGKMMLLAVWPRSQEQINVKYSLALLDVKTGRLRGWGGDPGRGYYGDCVVLSPDGRLGVSVGTVFETRTGVHRFREPVWDEGLITATGVFSPDSRLVAVSDQLGWVRELATERRLAEVPTRVETFSPDGRHLILLDWGRLVVWDLGQGKAVLEQPVPKDLVSRSDSWWTANVVFSPDGRLFATGHPDGNILLWRVPAVAQATARWSPRLVAALGNDLGQDDPARAYAAVWRCGQNPGEAVRSLAILFPPVAPLAAGEWAALMRRLDSRHFRERQAASRRLEELGRSVEEVLRQALKDKPTLEQRRRLEELLAGLTPAAVLRGKELRAVRGVAALEAINSASARRLLDEWARRPVEPRLAGEARRALERLKQRPLTSPE